MQVPPLQEMPFESLSFLEVVCFLWGGTVEPPRVWFSDSGDGRRVLSGTQLRVTGSQSCPVSVGVSVHATKVGVALGIWANMDAG